MDKVARYLPAHTLSLASKGASRNTVLPSCLTERSNSPPCARLAICDLNSYSERNILYVSGTVPCAACCLCAHAATPPAGDSPRDASLSSSPAVYPLSRLAEAGPSPLLCACTPTSCPSSAATSGCESCAVCGSGPAPPARTWSPSPWALQPPTSSAAASCGTVALSPLRGKAGCSTVFWAAAVL
jgi:hypothetical protein